MKLLPLEKPQSPLQKKRLLKFVYRWRLLVLREKVLIMLRELLPLRCKKLTKLTKQQKLKPNRQKR